MSTRTNTATRETFFDRLGARLQLARKSCQLTQEEVRQRAGFPNDNRLSQWERGTDMPRLTVDQLQRLASVYEMPVKRFFEDAFELPKYALPPSPTDPNYVVDPEEKILLASFRNLKGKERRMVLLVATEVVTLRDRRFEVGARARRHNWGRPDQHHRNVTAMEKAIANAWLQNHAEEHQGKWVAFRNGIPIDTDPEKDLLTARLVGLVNVLLIDLRDLRKIRFEGYSFKPKFRGGARVSVEAPAPFAGAYVEPEPDASVPPPADVERAPEIKDGGAVEGGAVEGGAVEGGAVEGGAVEGGAPEDDAARFGDDLG